MLGILLNILLFIGKFIAGRISGSVSIMADAFNNLTDAGMVCLSALGIKVAALGPGQKHQDGHGKFEWIIALITSLSVCLVGWELLRDSFATIKNPVDTVFSWLTLVILLVSIAVKVFLYFYNSAKSKAHGFLSLKAVALDSLADAISTTAVLLSLLLNFWFGWQLDGWFGVAVALLIICNSLKACSESVERLMGETASEKDVETLKNTVLGLCENKVDIYDVRIDDYGYGRRRAHFSLLPKNGVSVETVVELVPLLSRELKKQFGYETIIQSEKPAEDSASETVITNFKRAMAALKCEYEAHDGRVLLLPDGNFQLRITLCVHWWDEKEKQLVEDLLSDPVKFGMMAQDSIVARIECLSAYGYESRRRRRK